MLIFDTTAEKFECIAMSTNCTVNYTNNTEDGSHKDIVGMFGQPVVTSKSWNIQVDSLDVSNVAAMLTAIKEMLPFTLEWDEVSTSDNQTPLDDILGRSGVAYLSDVSFQFNDREFATKSLQFTGDGGVTAGISTTIKDVTANSYTKGQFVRLFLGSDNTTEPSKVIAFAKQLSLHVSLALEDSTTKDTTGEWQVQEPTGISYDISTTALMRSNDTIASGAPGGQTVADLENIYAVGTPVKFQIANVSGANNRTKGSVIVSGSVVLTSLTLNGPNRQKADYSAQFNGYGPFTVGS